MFCLCIYFEFNPTPSYITIPKCDTCIRYLVAWADDKLNFKVHIATKCCIAMWNLQKLKAIHDLLTEETCTTLVIGLVISHLDYNNAILVGLPHTDIHKLQ